MGRNILRLIQASVNACSILFPSVRSDASVLELLFPSSFLLSVFSYGKGKQKKYLHGAVCCRELPHLLRVEAIHLRREAPLPSLCAYHVCWLRREQQYMRVGALELR